MVIYYILNFIDTITQLMVALKNPAAGGMYY